MLGWTRVLQVLPLLLSFQVVAQQAGQEQLVCLSDNDCIQAFAQSLAGSQDLLRLASQQGMSVSSSRSSNYTQAVFNVLRATLANSSCCYRSQEVAVPIIGEVTPQLALVRWVASLPSQDGGMRVPQKLTPIVQIHALNFTTTEQILAYQRQWQDSYAIDVVDTQFTYYLNGLSSALIANPDNAGQDPQHPHGILHPRLYYLLFYHAEVLQRFNISTSSLATWDGLLAAAEKVHLKPFSDQDSEPGYAFCMDLAPGCDKAVYLLAAITASIVQAHGTPQGWCWDPTNMLQLPLRPLVATRVAGYLARIVQLSQLGATNSSSCNATNNLFAGPKLRCAFTFDWDIISNLMGRLTDEQGSVIQQARQFGALLVPGVTDPLNRAQDGYEECTPTSCPWATEEVAVNGTRALVNRAPFSVLAVSSDALFSTVLPRSVQMFAEDVWEQSSSLIPTWVNGRDKLLQQMASDWTAACKQGGVQPPPPPPPPWTWANSGVGIFNQSEPCATPDWTYLPPGYPAKMTQQWSPVAAYYNATASLADMERVVTALWQARWHPNNAPDLAVPMAAYYHAVLDDFAVSVAAANTSYKDILDGAVSKAADLFNLVTATVATGSWSSNSSVRVLPGTHGFKKQFDDMYGQSINFNTSTADVLASVDQGKHFSTSQVVLIAVLPAVVVLVALAAAGAFGVRRLQHRSLLLGRTKVPGLSPNTTLMITDIYNSTVLWETLPSNVMDTALRLHHQVIRTAAAQHGGYESALEGDAFILAFHTALDAMQAALQAQAGLLTAPWPQALLQHPDAREVWVCLPHAALDVPTLKPALAFRSMSAVFTGPGFPTHGDVFQTRRLVKASKSVLNGIRKEVEPHATGRLRALTRLLLPTSWGRHAATTAVDQSTGADPASSLDSSPTPPIPEHTTQPAGGAETISLLPATRTMSPPPLTVANPAGAEPGPNKSPLSSQPTSISSAPRSSAHLSRAIHSFRIGHGPHLDSLAEETMTDSMVAQAAASVSSCDTEQGTKPLLHATHSDAAGLLHASNPLQSEPVWLQTPAEHFDVEVGMHGPISLQSARPVGGSPTLAGYSQQQQQQQARRHAARRHSMWVAAAPPAVVQRAGSMLHQWRSKLSSTGTPTAPTAAPTGRSFTLNRMQSWRHLAAGDNGAFSSRSVTDNGTAPASGRHMCLLTQYAMMDNADEFDSPPGPAPAGSTELRRQASEPPHAAASQLVSPTSNTKAGMRAGIRRHSWFTAAEQHSQQQQQQQQQVYKDASEQPYSIMDVVVDTRVEAASDDIAIEAKAADPPSHTQAPGVASAGLAPHVGHGSIEPLSYRTWKSDCVAAWPVLASNTADEDGTSSIDSPGTHSSATTETTANNTAVATDATKQPLTGLKAVLKVVRRGKLESGKASAFRPVAVGSNAAALMFRGLRVRMGLHSGVHMPSEMSLNRTTQAQAYSGYPIKLAKAVGDAAAGGMVLLSGSTFNLVASQLSSMPGNPMPVYMGDSLFDLPGVMCNAGPTGDGAWARDAVPMYCVVLPELRPRLPLHEPLRGVDMVQHGNLDAATGVVCIAFVYVAGAAGLVADLGPIGTDALDVFQLMVTKLCSDHGGYVIEATEGLCLAVFADPAACALWCLSCVAHMKQHAWAAELLAHELCQEVVTVHAATGQLYTQQRGPRLRAGMHTGHVETHVNPRTGRMAYRGRVMNRAARIASKAQDGQVLSSAAATLHWAVQPAGTAVAAAVAGAPRATTVNQSPAPPQTPFLLSSSTTGSQAPAPSTTTLPRAACQGARTATPPSHHQQQHPQHLIASKDVSAQQLDAWPQMVRDQHHRLRASCVGTFALKGVSEMMTLYACTLADESAGA